MTNRRKQSQRGTNLIEFALVITPLTLLLLGVVTVGLSLGMSVRVAQICRDAASMYVRGVDFSRSGNKDVLVRLSQGYGMTQSGGDGVVILSRITWIPQARCTALNLNPCNGNRHVVTQRIVVGNASLRVSSLGSPNSSLLDDRGLVRNYMTEASAVAQFDMMTLDDGQYAYVAETFFKTPMTTTGVYSRAIF